MKYKKIKPRRSWGDLNPATKVVESKKKYKRSKEKKEWERILERLED